MDHNVLSKTQEVNNMVHIDLNESTLLQLKSTEIRVLLETWRVQDIVVFRTQRQYQSGGFGDPSKHPNIWAVAIMTDGQWARIYNARGKGREWSNLDLLEKWLREHGISQWQLLNTLDKTSHSNKEK